MYTRKPDWLKTRLPHSDALKGVATTLKEYNLNTVCESAHCPNIGTCFSKGTATFMILGNICSRNCGFCAVDSGTAQEVDHGEPERVSKATSRLGLKHVVVTSVTRDDLEDGGASQFAATIRAVKKLGVKIEVLIPDFRGDKDALMKVIEAAPDVLNHNVETVPRMYDVVRPEASYRTSLKVLEMAKELNPEILTKSGLMVGIGEEDDELFEVFRDLREVGCDILTVGQYLRPSKKHLEVKRFVTPERFNEYGDEAKKLGFKFVASAPLVRSSFEAGSIFI